MLGAGIWILIELRGRGYLPGNGIVVMATPLAERRTGIEVVYCFKGIEYKSVLQNARASGALVPISIDPDAPELARPVLMKRKLPLAAFLAICGALFLILGIVS